MCGIAGFSLSTDSQVQRTLAAQALLAGIAERGADAVGYAHRSPDGEVEITKLRGGASALLDELSLPPSACAALIHVRDFTKGHPEIEGTTTPFAMARSSVSTTASSRTTTRCSRVIGSRAPSRR